MYFWIIINKFNGYFGNECVHRAAGQTWGYLELGQGSGDIYRHDGSGHWLFQLRFHRAWSHLRLWGVDMRYPTSGGVFIQPLCLASSWCLHQDRNRRTALHRGYHLLHLPWKRSQNGYLCFVYHNALQHFRSGLDYCWICDVLGQVEPKWIVLWQSQSLHVCLTYHILHWNVLQLPVQSRFWQKIGRNGNEWLNFGFKILYFYSLYNTNKKSQPFSSESPVFYE